MASRVKFQVPNHIVGLVPINVVNRLVRQQGPSQVLGHDKTVFENIPICQPHGSGRMVVGDADVDIPQTVHGLPTLPEGVTIPSHNPRTNAISPQDFAHDRLATTQVLSDLKLTEITLLPQIKDFPYERRVAGVDRGSASVSTRDSISDEQFTDSRDRAGILLRESFQAISRCV